MALDPITVSLNSVLDQLGSPLSRKAYQGDWDRYTAWLAAESVHVLKARPSHVAAHIAFLRAKGRKKPTTARALSVIREVYRSLVRDDHVENNPAREVKNPKIRHKPNTPRLTQEQVRCLVNVPAETWRERRDLIAARILFGIGWRRAEVARIVVDDFAPGVDKKGNRILTVTGIVKGNKVLTVGVPDWLERSIAEWRAYARIEIGALLPRSPRDRRAVSPDIIYKGIAALAARAGVKISPHGLRRTNITLASERGVDLKVLQLSVGHETRATTELYDLSGDAAQNAPGNIFEDLVRPKEPT